ncbi:HisA/HisF-related TIM barrel protein [Aliikangiella coralliicola]|uniref:1-(5-phosphoribosyl)-5-((5-phosphoribosylamino)methylideneamino)imidazole-4-carboxamide isomerase n=1 Tax=Aliikangiella coralliicola TaxID=2592383 RepID=A0A545UFE2_9GAMM|nr:HisA/HisF-related TIM barrel protein [Aliikangiella coralliicola]TQV88189.1 hypothetical protein FLL46_06580 [Aliikangiella coralliicola]
MQLVPVLEIRHGKCVHTEPKNSFANQVVKEDAFEVVKRWSEKGVSRLHIVDVDAIESGEPENVDLIGKIKKAFPSIELQVLGGIKCVESAYIWADIGADFLVLNGRAIRRRNLLDDICVEFPNRVLVELDCQKGLVGTRSGEPAYELLSLARQLEDDGVVGLVVTEIPEKGGSGGANLIDIVEISRNVEMPVYANSRIEKLADLKKILESHTEKLSGLLIGKALHNGLCLSEANDLVQQYHAN